MKLISGSRTYSSTYVSNMFNSFIMAELGWLSILLVSLVVLGVESGNSVRPDRLRVPRERLEGRLLGMGKWNKAQVCPENEWISAIDGEVLLKNNSAGGKENGVFLTHVALGCTTLENPTKISHIIETLGVVGPRQRGFIFCNKLSNNPAKSLLIGLEIGTTYVPGYKRSVARNVHYLCGNEKPHFIPYRRFQSRWTILLCPPGSAICSLQNQNDNFGGVTYITNIRISCCKVPEALRQISVPGEPDFEDVMDEGVVPFEVGRPADYEDDFTEMSCKTTAECVSKFGPEEKMLCGTAKTCVPPENNANYDDDYGV